MHATRRSLAVAVALAVTAALAMVGATSAYGADGGNRFAIALSGANEIPENPHGDDDRGSVVLRLNQGLGRVCWRFGELTLTSGEPLPFAAHIHAGDATVAGPVVVTLFDPTTGTTPTSYPTATVCVTGIDRDLIKDIRKNPREYYDNAHNDTHPTGVVRGQLG